MLVGTALWIYGYFITGHPSLVDWRADAFRIIAPPCAGVPGVAAAGLCADRGAVAGAWVCLAMPLHYVAEIDNVRLAMDGLLTLSRAEADALAVDFNRLWQDSGLRMTAGRSAELYCIFDSAVEARTSDPQDFLGRHIEEYLPAGTDAPRLKRLMSEMEMWLFEHRVNGDRAARGLPLISGLWLWGGAAPLASLPAVLGFCAGDDVFFKAFASGQSQSGVIVLSEAPGSELWSRAESRWLEPAAALLRSGRISRLDLSAGDRCFFVSARGSRRFWRRRKPWWESFR